MEINTQKIKQIMQAKKVSTTQLAVAMGVKESWVYAVLNSGYGKTFRTVEKISKALGVKDKDIIL